MNTDTTERGLESLICRSLAGDSIERLEKSPALGRV